MTERLTILLIRIGLFFANCDGTFDLREKSFIKNYLRSLVINKVLPSDSPILNNYENIKVGSIIEIIQETNDFIQNLHEEERKPFVQMLNVYIQGIIKADDIIDPKEKLYQEIWNTNIIKCRL